MESHISLVKGNIEKCETTIRKATHELQLWNEILRVLDEDSPKVPTRRSSRRYPIRFVDVALQFIGVSGAVSATEIVRHLQSSYGITTTTNSVNTNLKRHKLVICKNPKTKLWESTK